MILQRPADASASAAVASRPEWAQTRMVATLGVLSLGLLIGLSSESILTTRLAGPYQLLAVVASVALGCVIIRMLWRSASDRQLWGSRPTHSWAVPVVTGVVVAALATVVVGTPFRARPEALASINFVIVLLAVAVAGISLRPIYRVLVIGDRDFHDHVAQVASRSRRQIVAWMDPRRLPPDGALWSDGVPADGIRYDEVVIQGQCFGRLAEVPPPLRETATRVVVLIPPRPHGRVPRTPGMRSWSSFFDSPIPRWGRVQKRVLDLAVASVALLVTSPLLLAAAALIVVDSPGAPIFRQERLGVDGRRFTLYKLRTMARHNNDAEHRDYVAALIRGDGPLHQGLHKLTADQRITRVGRVLRQFSIDELPQLWNVVRGQMSLVGPRPPLAREVELYDAAAYQRLRVKPGLTGLWQVSGRSQLSFHEMVELDAQYWESWTPLLDLAILLRTPAVVVTGRGAI